VFDSSAAVGRPIASIRNAAERESSGLAVSVFYACARTYRSSSILANHLQHTIGGLVDEAFRAFPWWAKRAL
jgi:hypothetical protein